MACNLGRQMEVGLRKEKNAGFSLIEVIVSIVILALLMLPALNCYISAAKVNTQSRIRQKATNLGQNLIEAIKNSSNEDILMQFNGVKEFSLIQNNLIGYPDAYQMKAFADGGYGEYINTGGAYVRTIPGDGQSSIIISGMPSVYRYAPPIGRSTYYLGIEGISEGDKEFDAFITIDATPYRDSMKYPDTMNNYNMPQLTELHQKGVTVLDLEGFTTTWSDDTESAVYDNSRSTDQQAIEYFVNLQEAYQAYLESLLSLGLPSPVPVAKYSLEQIKEAIQKDIQISVQRLSGSTSVMITCKIEYTCHLDVNHDGSEEKVTYELYEETYSISNGGDHDCLIYIFYTPSGLVLKDILNIRNNGTNTKLMLVKQSGTGSANLSIRKDEQNMAITSLYTNLSTGELDTASLSCITDYHMISRQSPKDRIYRMKVEIFEAGAISIGDFSNCYASFHLTKENEE